MEEGTRILVAPLDWGLGHATRCIPIIRELLKMKCEVFIASNGRSLYLLEKEFPHQLRFEISAYNPIYPMKGAMPLKIAMQLPKFMRAVRRERDEIAKIVRDKGIDLVISDNRYGCSHYEVKSVIITHQLHILMPHGWKWVEKAVNRFNHAQLQKFSECWVPACDELPMNGLTKDIGNGSLNIRNIGFLSRMEKKNLPTKYKVCVICTGPEPQRTAFEELMTAQLKKKEFTSILIKGKTEKINPFYIKNVQHVVANFLTSEDINTAIEESEIIISRSGYSTVMDLAKLGKKAIFVPTPGQTEQEYLAEELMRRGMVYSMKQSEFDLEKALKESEKYTGFVNFEQNGVLLKTILDSVL